MESVEKKALLEHFADLEDPRTRESPHRLEEILLVAICGILSGADGWTSVALWGQTKLDWLRQFLPFENGSASHDTFGRVFTLLDAEVFERCFIRWMTSVCGAFQGLEVAIDYISSLQADAERMGAVVRGHWGVENGLHWSLDVAYGEDQSRMREGNSAENFSILRRITLNLLKPDKTVKVGIKNKRLTL